MTDVREQRREERREKERDGEGKRIEEGGDKRGGSEGATEMTDEREQRREERREDERDLEGKKRGGRREERQL